MARAPRTTDPPLNDLDALEQLHEAEEADEGETAADLPRRPRSIRLPTGGQLPQSAAWLERLYVNDRIVREKKPGVFDHLRASGPFFVSVDNEPLSVLDGMSQTATVVGGFAEEPVVGAYMQGAFEHHLLTCDDTTLEEPQAAQDFAEILRDRVPGLPHVTFTNAGAEANEKALALCRAQAPRGATRVLAFEGSFHGRTLLALHATWNKKKREPFEIPGYEATFVPYPSGANPWEPEPEAPDGWLAELAEGTPEGLEALTGDDHLLAHELATLLHVDRELATGRYFACIVEPMQSEGGDRYATARFYRALRIVTRRHNVPLIFDEVQTGFGLGGTFAWHQRFELVDAHGRPDVPDAVTFAKRAQVGVVMSVFADPEPTNAHPASLVRGRVHASMVDEVHARTMEKDLRERLGVIRSRYPKLVGTPRGRGYAFAFDLPSPEHLARYLKQRFYRGTIVFGAGDRTVRYRLNTAFGPHQLDLLFSSIDKTLHWMDEHPGEDPPAWYDEVDRVTRRSLPGRKVRIAEKSEADELIPYIMDLEARTFEPARREPEERLRRCFEHPDAFVVVAEVAGSADRKPVGFALAVPVEAALDIDGPKDDPFRGRDNTLYSLSLLVDRAYRSMGLGRALKRKQIETAREMRRSDGSPRYQFVTGRNRVGLTAAMGSLNKSFGSFEVVRLRNQYGDPAAEAVYYRIPLVPMRPPDPQIPDGQLDFATGICQPLAHPPKSLTSQFHGGLLAGPAVNKITLCNYVTPAIVRAIEWVSALTPQLDHLYLASGRDELVDKALRVLRWHRPQARVAIGFEGGYLGHTSAAARSLSDPEVHHQGPGHFDWPRLPHPAEAGAESSLKSLRAAIEEAGAHQVFGILIEPVQERTGRVVPDDFWKGLAELRDELDVPVVLVETASAAYRSGRGPFFSSALEWAPDLLLWWPGGQTGFLHTNDRYFVEPPLTMVSTWDGDELSLIRIHHQLRVARRLELSSSVQALDEAVRACGLPTHGSGLYRVVEAGERSAELLAAAHEAGIQLRRVPGGRVAIAPHLDLPPESYQKLHDVLRSL